MKGTQSSLAVIVLILFVQLVEVSSAALAESCETDTSKQSWNRMEVLPGTGWDNLRNIDMSLVFEYDYSNCQSSNDRKFLLPDGCFAVPVQQSDVEKHFQSLLSTGITTPA